MKFIFSGGHSNELFGHPFWLDTYYNTENGKFHFVKSGDLVDRFNFIVPMTPDYTVRKYMQRIYAGIEKFCHYMPFL